MKKGQLSVTLSFILWISFPFGLAQNLTTTTGKSANQTPVALIGRSTDLQKALRFVEEVQKQTKCTKVGYLDVVLDHKRWKKEALLVLEVANLMTSLWRVKGKDNHSIAEDDILLYRSVRSIIMFSPSAFGSVICFDRNQYKDYNLFCPYAFKNLNLNGSLQVFDIALGDEGEGYDYTSDFDAIWWHDSKRKALNLTLIQQTEYYAIRLNSSTKDKLRSFTLPVVGYHDGVWTRPYFDCFGGKIWMVTYLAPFFNETNQFLGVVSIDIELSAIDINQCDAEKPEEKIKGTVGKSDKTGGLDSAKLVEFLGTHRCKASTKCFHIPHQGFKRGAYSCECEKGFYFPKPHSSLRGFNGSAVEHAYDMLLKGSPGAYERGFECLRCSKGCVECVDDRPCTFSVNIPVRVLLLVVNALVMIMAIGFGVAVYIYRHNKVIRASSPRFIIITIAGVVTMYVKPFFSFSSPSNALCITEQWFYHMGFVLAYSSIIIKTWRVAMIFRVRSAQRMALTDVVLMRRVMLILLAYVIYMMVWTSTNPPRVGKWKTSNGLFFERCSTEAWLEVIAVVGNLGLLTWGMWVCYQVRNAPSAYNESKFVSWAIYNAMFVTCFATVLRFTIRSSTTPDVMFAVEFVFTHSTATTMLLLIIIHKFVHIRKVQRVTNESSAHVQNASVLNTGDRLYVTEELRPTTEDNEELRGEVERLVKKVAILQAKLMKETNKHVRGSYDGEQKNSKRMSLFPAAINFKRSITTASSSKPTYEQNNENNEELRIENLKDLNQ